MFDAQLLGTQGDGAEVEVFSPWMPRGGDNVLINLDLVEVTFGSLTGTFEVKLYHRDTDGTGDGAALAGSISRDSAGRSTAEFTGLKELVRYRFRVSATTLGQEWALFRMLSPVWFDTVRA
jgi:hypothetical protein